MFERAMERARRAAEARAKARAAALAEQMREEAPRGIEVFVDNAGVRLSGRGLGRRFALDPALRWLAARLI
jgi:ABC-type transport system involved in cytochrome bd biosynthesis fused ATPase/permease subunit